MNRSLRSTRWLAIPALVAIVFPVAISSAGVPADQAGKAPQVTRASVPSERRATPTIRIDSFAFQSPRVVRPGATIRVVNSDDVPHTVTSRAFSVSIPAVASRTFRAPTRDGTYRFHCRIHPDMRGQFQVR